MLMFTEDCGQHHLMYSKAKPSQGVYCLRGLKPLDGQRLIFIERMFGNFLFNIRNYDFYAYSTLYHL